MPFAIAKEQSIYSSESESGESELDSDEMPITPMFANKRSSAANAETFGDWQAYRQMIR